MFQKLAFALYQNISFIILLIKFNSTSNEWINVRIVREEIYALLDTWNRIAIEMRCAL